MDIVRKHSSTSNILRVMLRHSTTNQGLTGLTSASSGMIISTIADVESSATAYTVAASKVETIATLGTFETPTATKVRFKEVSSTNHPGLYELQIDDARLAVLNAKLLTVTLSGATNLLAKEVQIQLDPVPSINDVALPYGDIILDDSFDYSNGNLAGNTPPGYSAAWDSGGSSPAGNSMTIVSSRMDSLSTPILSPGSSIALPDTFDLTGDWEINMKGLKFTTDTPGSGGPGLDFGFGVPASGAYFELRTYGDETQHTYWQQIGFGGTLEDRALSSILDTEFDTIHRKIGDTITFLRNGEVVNRGTIGTDALDGAPKAFWWVIEGDDGGGGAHPRWSCSRLQIKQLHAQANVSQARLQKIDSTLKVAQAQQKK